VKRLLLPLILPCTAFAIIGQDSPGSRIEGIAAVVGGEIILYSEIEDLVAYELDKLGGSSAPESLREKKRTAVLSELVNDRLLLNYAKQRNIEVEREELDAAIEERIDQIRTRFPSESSFIAQLEAEGLNMSRFRTLQRKAVEEQILKQRLQEQLRDDWRIQVTEAEIQKFCEERSDEIPMNPERVKLHHILLQIGPPPEVLDAADSLLCSIRARVEAGEDFGVLAKAYSQDGSASAGGDLGVFSRGSMVPEFEEAMEKLEQGEISDAVRTRFGLHLIQLIDKDADTFHARHIIRMLPRQSGTDHLLPRVEKIMALADTTSLEELAGEFSEDAGSKDQDGFLDVFAVSAMEAGPLSSLLDTLQENKLSPPMIEEDGLHLYWIKERVPAGKPPCDEIAPGIRDLLFMEKFEARLNDLLEQLKEDTYVEIHE